MDAIPRFAERLTGTFRASPPILPLCPSGKYAHQSISTAEMALSDPRSKHLHVRISGAGIP